MNIKLPTGKGETVVFWTEGEESGGGEPSRGVLTSDGDGAWSMSFEIGYDYQDGDGELVWEPGGVFRPKDLLDFNLELAKAFADACDRTHPSIIESISKGRGEFPLTRKPLTIVHVTGSKRWKATLETVGDDSYGHPMMDMKTTRPLVAAEWLVVTKRLAKASDWWTDRMGDMA